ncbi:LysM peptidoglycan-binding domain-containing protein [bacterium D16-51]|nr:LysM peptidoglycan-binding domain-containing protein [bacterium D16-59]RKI60173.1 LysM peptidoglycan-binding domain-containing protein [bacterium D16-51]
MNKAYCILPHDSIRQIFSIVFIIFLFFSAGYHITDPVMNKMGAVEQDTRISFKSISVTDKDTLWSIAKENYPEGYNGSLNDYIREIKRCNSLVSDCIYAGSSIVIPIL